MGKVLASLLSDERPVFRIPLDLTLIFLAFSFFVLLPISWVSFSYSLDSMFLTSIRKKETIYFWVSFFFNSFTHLVAFLFLYWGPPMDWSKSDHFLWGPPGSTTAPSSRHFHQVAAGHGTWTICPWVRTAIWALVKRGEEKFALGASYQWAPLGWMWHVHQWD